MTKLSALLDPSWLLTLTVWPILALVTGSLMPTPPEAPRPDETIVWQGATSLPLALDAPNPCNAKPTALDGIVVAQATVREQDGARSVTIDAAFENAGQMLHVDRLSPIQEQYTFALDGPPDPAGQSHSRSVDVPLTDRLSGSHLTLTIVSAVGPENRVDARLAQVALVCDPIYPEATPQ